MSENYDWSLYLALKAVGRSKIDRIGDGGTSILFSTPLKALYVGNRKCKFFIIYKHRGINVLKSFYNFVVTKLPPCPAAQVQQCSELTRCRAPHKIDPHQSALCRASALALTHLTPQTRTGSTLGWLAVGLDQSLCKKL